jgi:hypothetical protein
MSSVCHYVGSKLEAKGKHYIFLIPILKAVNRGEEELRVG